MKQSRRDLRTRRKQSAVLSVKLLCSFCNRKRPPPLHGWEWRNTWKTDLDLSLYNNNWCQHKHNYMLKTHFAFRARLLPDLPLILAGGTKLDVGQTTWLEVGTRQCRGWARVFARYRQWHVRYEPSLLLSDAPTGPFWHGMGDQGGWT